MKKQGGSSSYWRINVIVISILMAIWAIASCLCGIIFVEQLNEYTIGNLPLGFWMANQGSMLVFVVLILVYAVVMDVVDRQYRGQAPERAESRDN